MPSFGDLGHDIIFAKRNDLRLSCRIGFNILVASL